MIVGMAVNSENSVKVSIRKAGFRNNETINLLDIMKQASSKVGGECGGHAYSAAGAIIPRNKADDFIEETRKAIEERIAKIVAIS